MVLKGKLGVVKNQIYVKLCKAEPITGSDEGSQKFASLFFDNKNKGAFMMIVLRYDLWRSIAEEHAL